MVTTTLLGVDFTTAKASAECKFTPRLNVSTSLGRT